MAFNSKNRESQSRKVLEDLQQKKHLLYKQGISHPINPNLPLTPQLSNSVNSVSTDVQMNAIPQLKPNAILINPSTQSFGYFITQDSTFGNSILPVLPRL